MKKFTLLALSLCTSLVFAQKGLTEKPIDKNHLRNYDSADKAIVFYTGLTKIENSTYKYHIRYIKSSQMVDIYANDSINFTGKVVNTICEMKVKNEMYTPKKYIYEITDLDSARANTVGQMIVRDKIYLMPSDSLIKNYNRFWSDCSSIDFKYKINNTIKTATYNCPEMQALSNPSPELDAFIEYYQKIEDILLLDEYWKNFTLKLKKGRYFGDDGFMNLFYTKK